MSSERESELGGRDRVERNEAANVSTGMPAPDSNTSPSTILPSLVGRRIVESLSPSPEIARTRSRALDCHCEEVARLVGDDFAGDMARIAPRTAKA